MNDACNPNFNTSKQSFGMGRALGHSNTKICNRKFFPRNVGWQPATSQIVTPKKKFRGQMTATKFTKTVLFCCFANFQDNTSDINAGGKIFLGNLCNACTSSNWQLENKFRRTILVSTLDLYPLVNTTPLMLIRPNALLYTIYLHPMNSGIHFKTALKGKEKMVHITPRTMSK